MATVTNLTQYFLQGAVEKFSDILAPLEAIAYAVNQEGAAKDDVVRVPWIDGQTSGSSAFSYATGYATSGGNIIGKPVTMDTIKYCLFNTNDQEAMVSTPEAVTRLGNKLGNRLAADVLADLMSNVTATNFPSQSNYSGSQFNTVAAATNLGAIADGLNWSSDRYLLVNPTLKAYIMNNTTTLLANTFGSTDPVQRGVINNYYGFKVYMVSNLPANGSEVVQGFATAGAQGIGCAMAYHKPQDGIPYNAVEQVTDQVTGLTLGYREWGAPATTLVNRVLDVLYGDAVLDPYAVIRIKTTP